MPYFDATPAVLQRMFGIADTDLPDAALVVGQWGQGPYFEHVRSIWPDARDIEEHPILIDAGGRRIWVSVVFDGWPRTRLERRRCSRPSLVVGRDGVSRQLSRNKPIEPSGDLSGRLALPPDARP